MLLRPRRLRSGSSRRPRKATRPWTAASRRRTKQDVLRWSVVVVVALVFFGVYVAVLDNVVITPLLIAISGLGV